ncbi:MAG: RluA family pseudouridine synthase [Lachnospiraceae bacterium]|nr:RluA family pseudouridine synthase [Lachnospiraceae bacterium]
MKEFVISEKECGQRLDKYLFKVLDRAPGGFIYKMLRKKNIVLNDKKASGSEIIREKDCVRIYFSDETFAKFASSLPDGSARKNREYPDRRGDLCREPDFDIVYEDADILVINKPAGLLSQKAAPGDDSANDRILSYLLSSGQLTAAELRTFHPSVCNRLDRTTSGLLIAGKTMRGLQQTGAQLKDRSVRKYYLALVWGKADEPRYLRGCLSKDHRTNRVRILPDEPLPDDRQEDTWAALYDSVQTRPAGRRAAPASGSSRIETSYRPLEYFGGATLLEVLLITGRSHQIRAHLASVGLFILGDPKYGDSAVNHRLYRETGIHRQLLHAWRMELADGRILEAEEPDDFKKAKRWLAGSTVSGNFG